ncbi:ABC transporter permease [Arthrobacter sp. Sa2CUA1]|uniref:ABC transporter permease n=1 Tax=Arthrobacter gallicola TaxID=2762225 RepID=A0ABR8UN91_9MICC|nr:ABC transporter permease [Arthrobacter gallicola]MBD7994014.1 ABC transporter permease [Arthrobacter gallicola]
MTDPAMTRRSPSASTALLKTETRLFLRNPVALFMALGFPAALLLLQGLLIPGTRTPLNGPGSPTALDLFVPMALCVVAASVGLTNLPSTLGGYRQLGLFRRLGATPAGAHRVLTAQLVVSAASLLLGAAVAAGIAVLALGAQAPRLPFAAVGIFLLAALSMLALGAVIGARTKSAQAANGLGTLALFASLFFAGVWTPGPLMPEPFASMAAFTPLGAATESLTAAWYGDPVDPLPLAVMAVWTGGCALLAVRLFRWR